MFKPFGQREQNKKQKSVSLWNREFDIVAKGLDEKQVSEFIEELISRGNDSNGAHEEAIKSLVERAVADAEDIINSVKNEAQNEAVRIIDEAKRRADEIKKDEELSLEKGAEEIISLLNKNLKASNSEAKQIIQQFLLQIKGDIESEVRKEYRDAHSRLLYSLLGTSEDAVKEISVPVSSQIKLTPEIVLPATEEDKVENKVDDETKEEQKDEIEEAKTKAEEKTADAEVIKSEIEVETEKEEIEKVQTEEKQDKGEAAEKQKTEEEEKKNEKDGMSLFARISAFKDRLNDRLSQPIGGKQARPVPRQGKAHKEETAEQVKPEKAVDDGEKKLSPDDKSKELMDLVYADDMTELTRQTEEMVAAGDVKEDEMKTAAKSKEDKKGGNEEATTEILKSDEGTLYTGDVEISVEVPVNLVAVSKLYNYLQTTPDIKVLYTKGSWDKATIIMVALDKPLPLIDMISRIPGIKVVAKLSKEESEIKGAPASLLGTKKEEIRKIIMILKEA